MKVFITGGTSGIGRATVTLLSLAGHEVSFSGRSESRGSELSKSTGAKFIQGDLSTTQGCKLLTEKYFETYDQCDVLVNNAGVWTEGVLENTSDEEIENVFKVNSLAPIILSKYFVLNMKQKISENKQKFGRLIFVNSLAGLTSKKEREIYCASKWAITGFTKGLSKELSSHQISVTNLCPGAVNTELFDHGGYPRDTSGMMDPLAVAQSIKFVIDQPRDVQILELAVQPTNYD